MADEEQERPEPEPDRRGFLTAVSTAAMSAGLIGGYGAFAMISGRFLYPARAAERGWQFVIEADRIAIGDTLLYRSPSKETVNITRKERNGVASDFIALSSTCPHLGCQVHWEGQNNRYFCPCHNGVFTPDGVGVSGPPGDAGQSLPRYALKIEQGLLYIEVGLEALADGGEGEILDRAEAPRSSTGHDPCLEPKRCSGKRFA